MTSLREAAGGRPIDRDAAPRRLPRPARAAVEALRGGRFDVAGWAERQVTTGPGRPTRPAPTGVETGPRARRRRATGRPGRRWTRRRRRRAVTSLVGEVAPRPAGGRAGRAGCNAMARRCSGRVSRPEEAGRAPRPPRSRPPRSSRRPGATRPGSRPCTGSTWPRCTASPFYELARPSRGRGRHRADVPRRPGQPRPVRGARPARRRRGRLARSGSGSSRSPATSSPNDAAAAAPAARGAARGRGRRSPARSTSRRDVARRDEAGAALGGRRPAAGRPPPGRGPALRRRDVHRRDRRRPGPLRGRRPGPHPPRPAQRRARPRRPGAGDRAVDRSGRRRDRGAHHRPLPRRAAGGAPRRRRRPRRRARACARPSGRCAPPTACRATCRGSIPSFRFEEALAARLAAAASPGQLPVAPPPVATGPSSRSRRAAEPTRSTPALAAYRRRPPIAEADPRPRPRRPLLIGGAARPRPPSRSPAPPTSPGAWPAARPRTPMARAPSAAVARTRLA